MTVNYCRNKFYIIYKIFNFVTRKLTESKDVCKFPRDRSKEQHQRQLLVQEQGAELQSIIRQVRNKSNSTHGAFTVKLFMAVNVSPAV
jgi:hypothetical protein